MLLYFKRDDGGYSQVDETTNPTTAKEYKEQYQEISKEEFESATAVEISEYTPTYEELVQQKLIAKGYDKDRQIAILCNKEDGTPEHLREFEEMQLVRNQCKNEAKIISQKNAETSILAGNAIVRVVQEYPYVDKQGVKHNDKIRHYAVDDQGNRYKMKCSGLVALVDEAIDDFPCKYVYKATNIRVEK